MQIILLERIKHLGNLGDNVKVRPGFARNYLIPHGKALPATQENIERFEARRSELEKMHQDQLSQAESRAARLNEMTIAITARVAMEGKLFGSVNANDICDAIAAQGMEVKRQEVRLPEGAIRNIGEHEVVIHLHPDVEATLKLQVIPEN